MDPFSILRIVVGLIFFFFVPGYAMTYAIFPKKEVDGVERLTFSLAFSVSAVPLFILILNQSLGVELFPIDLFHSLLASFILILFSVLVWLRRTGRRAF